MDGRGKFLRHLVPNGLLGLNLRRDLMIVKIKRFNFFVVRGKTLFLCIAIALLFCIYIGSGGIIGVFGGGERLIPIYSAERSDNKTALTFNCAWNDEDIGEILDILDKYHIRATFFAVGDWAEKYPEAVGEIVRRGHEMGNHSYNHAHYSKMSRKKILEDMDKCDDIIEKITGVRPTLFRAAYGEYTNDVISACTESGRTYIQWSVDSLDYKEGMSAEDIYERVVKNLKRGDIILMHCGTKNTAAALDKILDTITKEFSPCRVSELIYTDNYTIDNSGRQRQNPAEEQKASEKSAPETMRAACMVSDCAAISARRLGNFNFPNRT